jgi:hypothetical protein
MALFASVPSEGSTGAPERPVSWDDVALWATGGSSLVSAESDAHGGSGLIVPHDRPARVPDPC